MEIFKGEKEVLDAKAAELIADSLKRASKKKTHVLLGTVGGNGVIGVLKKLKEADIDWTFVEIFMADENFVDWDSKDSNYGQAKRYLIEDLLTEGKLPGRNVHAFGPKEKVKDYEAEFIAAGGEFDVVLLNLEVGGRIASLFPGGDGFVEDENFIEVEAPTKPKERMTATKKNLMNSKNVILLANGLNKKQDYKNFLDEKKSEKECPAKFLENVENLYVLTDLE